MTLLTLDFYCMIVEISSLEITCSYMYFLETLMEVWENSKKGMETLACWLVSPQLDHSPTLPLAFLSNNLIMSLEFLTCHS